MKSAKMPAIVLAVAAAGMASMSIARADEAQAKGLLKAMSDYLGAQKTISFEYDANLEFVTKQQQKIGLASSGTLALERPEKFRATRTGGFANVEMVFDGKTLSLLGKNGEGQTTQMSRKSSTRKMRLIWGDRVVPTEAVAEHHRLTAPPMHFPQIYSVEAYPPETGLSRGAETQLWIACRTPDRRHPAQMRLWRNARNST
jgi:hypothetical protein